MKKLQIVTLSLAALGLIAWATNNPIKVVKVKKSMTEKPVAVEYHSQKASNEMLKRVKQREESSAKADFSIQGAAAQKTVWSENFDNGMPSWSFDGGEGDVITFTLSATSGNRAFSQIDENDVQSLYIDGPYQVYKRTIGTATTGNIHVPNNGQFHCYVNFDKMWNDYVVLTISVSDDDFATETELWNSTETTVSGSHWEQIDCNLDAFANKDVKVRFTYGPGTNDTFKTGGYMGSFYVDGISVTGVETIDHISTITGEDVAFIDMSTGTPTAWEWTFMGATPKTSTEQNPIVQYTQPGDYDVSLKVTFSDGTTDEITKPGFVHVDGQVPVAQMITPASFRDANSRVKMVCPLVPVQYHDASTGFPDEWTWAFETTGTSLFDIEYSHECDPWMTYNTLDTKLYSVLTVTNDSGTTYCTDSIVAKYSGLVNNILSTDYATNYDMGEATFPGAMPKNSPIKAYAEKFSKPSRPIKIFGAYVYFTKAQAEEIYEQVMPITFQLCESDNGKPGKVIDSDSWTIPEIGYAISTNNGFVTVEFSTPHIIKDEFFITIDGFTDKTETFEVAFGMAPLRDHDNTAYMLYNDAWRPMTGYFAGAPGGQTSFYVYADIAHSALAPIVKNDAGVLVAGDDYTTVGAAAGTVEQAFFSYLGREEIKSDADWCKVISKPNGLTLDTLTISFDALPDGIDERTATLTFSDGADEVEFRVIQQRGEETSVKAITNDYTLYIKEKDIRNTMTVVCPAGSQFVEVINTSGKIIARHPMTNENECTFNSSSWNSGVYIVRANTIDGFAIIKVRK